VRYALLACLLIVGCGGGGGPVSVDVGTGVDRFVEIHDGDPVPIIMGLQGGFHIWGSVRAINMSLHTMKLRFTLFLDGNPTPVTVRTDNVDLTSTGDGVAEHLGSAVFLPDPAVVRRQRCRMHLDATDASGRSASAEHVMVPEGP
jgi:hypothetical protein